MAAIHCATGRRSPEQRNVDIQRRQISNKNIDSFLNTGRNCGKTVK
jgi:hypothetical protein